MSLKQSWLGLALLAMAVTACGPLGLGVGRGGFPTGRYASNGERIYFTGTSAKGRVTYSGGDFGGMMGGRGMMSGGQLACADCHGPDGRGGQHVMHMTVMDAPDIRWSALAEAEHGDHGDDGDEEEIEHPPYDEETFRRAVTRGLDPGGDSLDAAMPRWRMSEQDLEDLVVYFKTLG
jgi:hypothetical protein